MKVGLFILIAMLSLNAFAVDISNVPSCVDNPKTPDISEDLVGHFWAHNEFIHNGESVSTSELFTITSDTVLQVPQLYSVNGNPILEEVEKYYCLKITGKDKKVKDSLKIKLVATHRNRFSADRTTITYWLKYNDETQTFSWQYKISDKAYLLFLVPVGSSFWSYDYPAGKAGDIN